MEIWKYVLDRITDPNTLVLTAIIAYLLMQNRQLVSKMFGFQATLVELVTLIKVLSERKRERGN